ncbi:MAG: FAD-dependent oxidoreductase [Treponema sp.]|jgi:2,4-dienoyl-CoA reductase-like NADH-dependent reductase (Old Yellow Enzyme family)/thioredoxin reductase|nr:FAD-dependent oxidoreductase [Treponema sp.]
MKNNFDNLFSPVKINNLTMKNRIFVPPMGTSHCTTKGEVTEALIRYFVKFAKGGAGAIVMEVADVDGQRRYNQRVMGIYDDFLVPGWKKMADAIHQYDTKLFAQLLHAGPIPLFNDPSQLGPIGASSVPHIYNLRRIPHALTIDEMEQIKQLFINAALRAAEAGCDGIEVHCAHNHGLLGSWVSPLHNKRADEYGGDIFGRMKYPIEIIAAIRKAVGPDYPIGVRISACHMEPEGLTVDDTCLMAKIFEEASVDYLHVSNGTLIIPSTIIPPAGGPMALNADYSKQIKKAVSIPVGVVGRIKNPWVAEEIIVSGKADFTFLGRSLICDPDMPNKVKDGNLDDIRPCISCSECVTSTMFGGAISCSMNSEVGHELEGDIEKADLRKKVLIAGGGIGGLEAARVAALRGHDVTTMEKSNHLGGQFELAAYPPAKQELANGLKYKIREVHRLGVRVEVNKAVTKKIVEDFGADAVIVATGGKPIIPSWLKNSLHKNIVTAWDALRGEESIDTNILVIGGGQVGCETADYLAQPHYFMRQGARKITIIEMQNDILADDFSAGRDMLIARLLHKNVTILTGAKVVNVLEDGVVYEKDGSEHRLSGIDTIIAAIGTIPDNALIDELAGLSIPVIPIGDAVKARKLLHAAYEGAKAAKSM